MGVVYLAALLVGVGIVAVQLVSSAGHGDIGHAGDAGGAGDGGDDAEHPGQGAAFVFLSLRFWTYGAFAFGIMGTALHGLGLAGPIVTAVAATGTGLASGLLAALSFRALASAQTSSGAGPDDVVGQVGRVLLPCSRGARGKIRVEVRGQTLDFVASTDEEVLEAGATVLVEELRGEEAHVSRAPPELQMRNPD